MIGIIMIFFALKLSKITVAIRFFRPLLLVLPVSIVLAGCDSASSTTTDNSNQSKATSVSNQQDVDSPNTIEDFSDDSASDIDLDNKIDDNNGGQSLLAAAKSADNRSTPTIAGKRDENGLQATLMGDYHGMFPCTSCDSIDSTLNLFADGSVLKTSIYNNPETAKAPLVESGVYRQDDNNITIVYEDKNIELYRIQDNHLIMIDEDKNLDTDYTLWRK